ncbi:ImmA/IrrE family metallo-endopeptidase [Liquorilactobacillus satsumensis]|uniref:spr1629 family repressor/antitoxin n=1 Tax=Liquorilactobacillus TaxID=2767888 RepID=UPI0021C2994E|nr:XRE family transcriptional regulator [Liquorilactobacillus satsumensis]MCP9313444.1 ImmA/IrrE family metallo-endopeptidase [Liquorilactobacillus satsumensis]MCP9360631.1 ImmA/IrrE family metallo-endopeptidase [Liquorilactobacillus satsumensis]
MFYGKNVKILRDFYGMSRKELGDKLFVTEQAIGQYENSEITPEITNLIKLSQIFKVKSQFFLTKPFITEVTPEKSIAYRSTDRDSRKRIREGVSQINIADAVIGYCESFFNLRPSVLKVAVSEEKALERNLKYKREDVIEKSAKITRKLLKVQNNKDLLFYVENAGAYVIERGLENGAGAYSVWTRNSDNSLRSPFVVLGMYNKSAVRRIFDIAHELGHLILHSDVDFNDLEKNDFRHFEKEANDFASCLLLPKETMPQLIKTVKRYSVPDDYVPIKRDYWVSLVTVEYRAFKLNLISKEDNKNFFANRYRKRYTKIEPLDREMPVKKPGKIEALMRLVNSKIMPFEQLISEFLFEPQFVGEVFNFSDEFLESMLPKKDDYSIYRL